jgi:hypothetical protein
VLADSSSSEMSSRYWLARFSDVPASLAAMKTSRLGVQGLESVVATSIGGLLVVWSQRGPLLEGECVEVGDTT